ncbi:winged helix DNA-binding domain-containing protein [Phytomonospora endophytica]|uniref:Winged helix DNA-binding domain-containing protein n=1 Tax=Phytomonospora endophytica TaxID=714109 RepID=A0A841FCH5_9ACTN|nr:winged helix DNA-binding domain-containing protein [Phytomonospora endophytica]MBB6034991.1 hypothetical protein [Phytomonospora endophytica]GIG71432.1 hypothetical protein Pen01_77270 [Phytomonospora endophytica]
MNRLSVLRYRHAAQGLDRPDGRRPLLDLGVQDTPPGSALVALTARGAGTEDTTAVWSHRGAPHLHRREDLPGLAAALLPHSSADALARMAGAAPTLKAAGVDGQEAVGAVAAAMREATTEPRTKGELSALVTAAVDDAYAYHCKGCDSVHVYESLFRLGALPAGLVITPGSRPLTFTRIEEWTVPTAPAGTGELIARFLAFTGPSTHADTAAFLGTAPPRLAEFWPGDLTEVDVDGRRAFLPGDLVDAVEKAERPSAVRLLPPTDAFLLGDRELLLPDKTRRGELFKNLSRRGALLVDAEITGHWQMRTAGKRLDVTVTPFTGLDAETRRRVESEAGLLATARGLADVRVTF